MSKLIYPSDGIYKYCKNYIDNCSRSISKAINNCSFDIPSDFAYRNYLNSLENTLYDYRKELDDIDFKLRKSNNNYDILESDLTDDSKKIIASKIKERDRMIV